MRSRMRSWKRLTSGVMLMLLLSGCAGVASSCPPIVEYSPEEQADAANDIEFLKELNGIAAKHDLPPPFILPRFMGDYMVLRDQIRACR